MLFLRKRKHSYWYRELCRSAAVLVPLTPAARFCARTSSFCPKACCGRCTRTVLPAAYYHGPPPCQVSAMQHKAFRVLPKKECEGGRRSQYKGHQPGASHISTTGASRRSLTHSLTHSSMDGVPRAVPAASPSMQLTQGSLPVDRPLAPPLFLGMGER